MAKKKQESIRAAEPQRVKFVVIPTSPGDLQTELNRVVADGLVVWQLVSSPVSQDVYIVAMTPTTLLSDAPSN